MPKGEDPTQSHRLRNTCLGSLGRSRKENSADLFRLKHGLLDEFLRQQLKNPTIAMRIA